MNIHGEKVILRAIEYNDLPSLLMWSNDPEVQSMLGGWHFPVSRSIQERWWQQLAGDELNQRFAIDSMDHGLIGTANLVAINWKDRNAITGTLIGRQDLRRQGYGTDTVMAIMRYAFEELNLQRLETTIIEYNQPSYELYISRCGWKEEGRKCNYYWRRNRYWDQVLAAILRDRYYDLGMST